MEYKIKLNAYEGPLDLLLDLIHKSKIDIYDIPINTITEQFIEYIKDMEVLDLDIASEFLVMAATLLEIKSKMLLPKEKIILDDMEVEIDPRAELVKRLMEYKLYKDITQDLRLSELIESKVFYKPREDLSSYSDLDLDMGNVDLDMLVKAIHNVLTNRRLKSRDINISEVQREEFTISECIRNIEEKLSLKNSIKFSELLNHEYNREEIITYFLSLLELIRLKSIYIMQDELFGDLIINKRIAEDE